MVTVKAVHQALGMGTRACSRPDQKTMCLLKQDRKLDYLVLLHKGLAWKQAVLLHART